MPLNDFARPARLAAAAILIAAATPVMAEGGMDFLGVPGPISFAGAEYEMDWSTRNETGYYNQEYLPAGQELETYTEMFMVQAVTSGATPESAAAAMVSDLNRRKGNDPVVNYEIIQNDATGEIILDFVLSDSSTGTTIVEWNAYRYAPLDDSGDGVALYAISLRSYGDDGAREFLTGLKTVRPEMIDALAQFEAPALDPVPIPQ